MNGEKRLLTKEGFKENNFSTHYLVKQVDPTADNYPTGTEVARFETDLFTPAGPTH